MYLDIERLPGYSRRATWMRAQLARVRERATSSMYAEVVADLKSSRGSFAAYGRFRAETRSERSVRGVRGIRRGSGGDASASRAATFEALVESLRTRTRHTTESRLAVVAGSLSAIPRPLRWRRFSRERASTISLSNSYLHWQDRRFNWRRMRSRSAPRPIGLYRDLAVGSRRSPAPTRGPTPRPS